MSRILKSLGFGLTILLASCRPPDSGPPALVRVVPATLRVTRSQDLDGAAVSIKLSAARNEFEPFQVVVQARGRPLRNVRAAATDLTSAESGHVISRTDIALFREYFLNVLQPTGDIKWMTRQEYPDPLLPFQNPYSAAHEPYGAPFDNSRIGSVGQPYVNGRRCSGAVFASGGYTGRLNRSYVIQIDHPGAAGQATFRWSDSWKRGLDVNAVVKHWNAEHVPIPALPADGRTEMVPLNDGVAVRFCAGADPQFEQGQTFHFNTYATMNEVIWGEVYVSSNTPPGMYTGTVTVSADDMETVHLPMELNIWDFEIPREKSITTAFNGWMTPDYYVNCPQADWLFEQLLHEHRMDLQTIHGQSTAWPWRFGNMDWSQFDTAAEPRLNGSLYRDGVPQKRFQLNMYSCGSEYHWPKHTGGNVTNVEYYGKLYAEHLKKKGWFDRVYMYCRDEPYPEHIPGILRDIQAFIRADPDWRGKFMVTSRPTADSPLLDWIDIWCVKYHWGIEPAVLDRIRAQGKKLWCYVANTPMAPNPSYHVDSLKGYEPRLIKWAAWRMGAEGFLHWAMVMEQDYPNPWTTPMNDFGACGDANFIYYGARNGARLNDNATPLPPIMGPVPGFRLKQIREGLEDWEYLLLCEKRKGRAFTEELAAQVYRGPGGNYGQRVRPAKLDQSWTQDERKIYEVRARLAAAIRESP